METIASKTRRRLQRTFEKRARAQFGERLQKLEWLDDDPYEPSGERVAGLLHAALHIKRAKPQDSSLSTSIAYQVMADFNDTYIIMTHTLPE